jgi:hypothetical protein
VDGNKHRFWGNQWTVAVIGGTLAIIIGGVILTAITSGPSGSPSGASGSPSSRNPAVGTATTPATIAARGVYHQGRLALAYNGCADLDAPASDPTWGELTASGNGGGGDICSQYPSLYGANNATLVAVNSGTDTTCQSATGWIASGTSQSFNLSVGSFLCVHTNQNRYSLLRVVSINSADSSIVFSAKTFK